MPIIKEKQINRNGLEDLRDPLVGREVDPKQPLVQCVNCETTYFQSSYDSLVQSNRGQCLNCKGDKYFRLEIVGGQPRSDRWGKSGKVDPGAKKKATADTDFIVRLAYQGPILPPPVAGETWSHVLSEKAQKKIRALKLDDGGMSGQYHVMAWKNDNEVVFGSSRRIYHLDMSDEKITKVIQTPVFSAKKIYDFDVNESVIAVTGKGFFHHQPTPSSLVRAVWDPFDEPGENYDWNRVTLAHRDRWKAVRCYKTADVYFQLYDSIKKTKKIVLDGATMFFSETQMKWSPTDHYIGLFKNLRWANSFAAALDVQADQNELALESIEVPSGDDECIGCMAWHPTKDVFAVAFYTGKLGAPHGFRVIDARTRQVIFEQEIDRHHITTVMDWSADGRFVALGGYDCAIFVWDFDLYQSHVLLGHKKPISEVRFSPDAQRLVSQCEDGQIFVWDAKRAGSALCTLRGYIETSSSGWIHGSPWSPSGRRLATSRGGAGIVELK